MRSIKEDTLPKPKIVPSTVYAMLADIDTTWDDISIKAMPLITLIEVYVQDAYEAGRQDGLMEGARRAMLDAQSRWLDEAETVKHPTSTAIAMLFAEQFAREAERYKKEREEPFNNAPQSGDTVVET